ncbi:MAG: S1 RNA-binding domain-containing protein, partial [Flavobacteriales bacterium]|nr:S1 RNA-binding domain-containing protein [Flavobacteriales bacterium]
MVKLDRHRGNVVVSRRAIQERQRNESRDEILSKLKVGDIVEGTCKSVLDWGCFLDLSGIDSLLHITDLSFSRVNHPSELISVGQTIKCMISKIENGKISVSTKALTIDPYVDAIKKYKVGGVYKATISKITEFGAFGVLEHGLEGLIHSSELSWQKKNISPRKVLSTSQQVDVQILEISKEKRRISLSYRNTLPNPWKKMEKSYPVGSTFEGTVSSISDFGIFVTVPNIEIKGLVHFKDLSWSENPEVLSKYKKNTKIKCKVVEVDLEKEKLKCSVRELTKDPFDFFKGKKEKDIVTVFVKDTTENSINVSTLKNDNENGFITAIKRNQIAVEKEDARPSRFSRGDKIDSMITAIDFQKRTVALSIKALEEQMNKEAI